MRPPSGIAALPADLRQQLLAMPLTADEKSDVAWALLKLALPPKTCAICHSTTKNAPQVENRGAFDSGPGAAYSAASASTRARSAAPLADVSRSTSSMIAIGAMSP